ncbi:MAG: hypothetical protein ACRDV4_08590, partial [Acidimicrobiales bacterium]
MTEESGDSKRGRHLGALPRRAFLRRAAALAGLPVVGAAAYGVDQLTSGSSPERASKVPAKPRSHDTTDLARTELARTPDGVTVPRADWVVAENSRQGTTDWVVTGYQTPRAIEGFADSVSATPGDEVTLFVNTTARSFH